MRTVSTTLLTASFLVLLEAVAGAPRVTGAPSDLRPLSPASSGGLAALDRALVRLSGHQRLLMIAAHPDDEETSILTWVARGRGGEVAYLSLSRGDGGQNLIGSELGEGLGLLRSRELEAARRVDGAWQFFSRAYDFGYTRSLDETLERWPKELLLEDAMRVVRRFKPQVLVAVWPASAAAGHGQHWVSGLVAEEVFRLSADPSAFPRLDAEGLPPWEISAFYRLPRWSGAVATQKLELGTIEPFSGRSILQLALESRSQHRCQDMGSLQPLGDAESHLSWVAGAGGPDGTTPFAGIDTRLAAIVSGLPTGEPRREAERRLERIEELARATRAQLAAGEPGRAVPALLEIVGALRAAEGMLSTAEGAAAIHARELIQEKLTVASEALANAAGIVADAVTERQMVVPGETFEARSILWNVGELTVDGLSVAAAGSGGWRLVESTPAPSESARYAPRVTDERAIRIEVPADALATAPYFLSRPRQGDLYDWSDVPAAWRGEPFAPPPLSLRFDFRLGGVPVRLEREVVFRTGDQAIGEVRRPLRAVPALEVAAQPPLAVWPIGAGREEPLRVTVRSNVETPVRARLDLALPPGWRAEGPLELALDPSRRSRTVELTLIAPESLAPGRYDVAVAAVTETGERFVRAYPLIDYPHVRPVAHPASAEVELWAGDIRFPELRRVGYVRGASDRVPEQLLRLGVPLEVLPAADLANRDLADFDAIVVGSRAYEVDPALAAANPRLLDYARGGGTLIVQYQQYQFVRGGHPPFPLEIRRPHDRITDETARVTVLDPSHPVFTTPHRLSEADWEGWVQERGLYFAGTWDDAYRPLLAMADPGGEEKRGGLLVARLGAGHYVYTGLAFFRQLPAGVVGAYRLFANLLALGRHGAGDENQQKKESHGR